MAFADLQFTVLLFCASILASNGSDILAIFPTPSYSHQIVYRTYVNELLRRGHNLTVVTTDPINDPTLKNYREIDVSFSYDTWNKRFVVASDTAKLLRWVPEVFLFAFSDFMDEICDLYLQHPEVNKLIRDGTEFDLFVVEFGVSSCFYPFARQSRNNFVGILSMSAMSFVQANAGNVATPSYIPDSLLGELSSLTFPKRIRATIFQAIAWIVYSRTMRNHHEICRKYFGENLPPLQVYERNVSAILLNDHFTVTFPRPVVPNVPNIGGPAFHLLRRTLKDLPKILILCMNFVLDIKNRQYFGWDLPSLINLEKDVDLVLSNSYFTIQNPRPLTPNIIQVGGRPFYLEGYKPNPLPQDLQRFLDAAKEGVIYFSLGSNVKSKAMPIEKRQIFIQAFSRIKQKVLWKWEEDTLPGKPDNVKIGKWFPQTEILAHPNVKAFVTQGGLQSVSEAVYFKVPMIVIPFFADQELNAKKLSSESIGIHIDYETLDTESFHSAIEKIINDPGYKERIVKYSALTQDQPQSPLDRAVWWTEYVIRHKGARHLRSAAVDMPWYQYLLLDVFAFILVVLLIVFYTMYKLLSFMLRLLLGKSKVKKE